MYPKQLARTYWNFKFVSFPLKTKQRASVWVGFENVFNGLRLIIKHMANLPFETKNPKITIEVT